MPNAQSADILRLRGHNIHDQRRARRSDQSLHNRKQQNVLRGRRDNANEDDVGSRRQDVMNGGKHSCLLSLPVELQVAILGECDYVTLKKIRRTCKHLLALIDDRSNQALGVCLFRSGSSNLSIPELVDLRASVIAQHERRPVPAQDGREHNFAFSTAQPRFDLAINLHPALSEAVWSLEESRWEEVQLVVGAHFTRTFHVADLALRHESATAPALGALDLTLTCPAHAEHPHERTLRKFITAQRSKQCSAVSVEQVLRGLVSLTHELYNLSVQDVHSASLTNEEAFRNAFAHRTYAEGPSLTIHLDGTVELSLLVHME